MTSRKRSSRNMTSHSMMSLNSLSYKMTSHNNNPAKTICLKVISGARYVS